MFLCMFSTLSPISTFRNPTFPSVSSQIPPCPWSHPAFPLDFYSFGPEHFLSCISGTLPPPHHTSTEISYGAWSTLPSPSILHLAQFLAKNYSFLKWSSSISQNIQWFSHSFSSNFWACHSNWILTKNSSIRIRAGRRESWNAGPWIFHSSLWKAQTLMNCCSQVAWIIWSSPKEQQILNRWPAPNPELLAALQAYLTTGRQGSHHGPEGGKDI